MSIDESNIYDEVYTYTKEGKYFKFNTDEFEFSFYYDQNQIVFIKESEDNIIRNKLCHKFIFMSTTFY